MDKIEKRKMKQIEIVTPEEFDDLRDDVLRNEGDIDSCMQKLENMITRLDKIEKRIESLENILYNIKEVINNQIMEKNKQK